jgi:hypothetical protein
VSFVIDLETFDRLAEPLQKLLAEFDVRCRVRRE